MAGLLDSILGRGKKEHFVSVDIGSSSIKMMEFDVSGSSPRLVSACVAPTPAGAINNNIIVRPDQVAAAIRALVDANEIKATKATFSIPGPTAFTKKVILGMSKLQDLKENIAFEASNYIPHKIEAVHLDFQVLRVVNQSNIEVLLVAVKNEVLGSYLNAIEQSGLEPAIADVDFFALENMFELNYPEEKSQTVALVDVGAKYANVSIYQNGMNLFAGDVSVGARLYTDALCETLGLDPKVAERAKSGEYPDGVDPNLIRETLDRTTDHISSELQRQIGFFWNAAATDRPLDAIYVTGGGTQIGGLIDELGAKTGVRVARIEPFKLVDVSGGFDQEFLGEIAPQMGVCVGLSLRRFSDKPQVID